MVKAVPLSEGNEKNPLQIFLYINKKYFLRLIIGCLLLCGSKALIAAPNDSIFAKNALGIAVGAPQTIAVVYDRSINKNISLQVHAGSAVLFSSAGIRLNWLNSQRRLFPYLFAGSVLIHSEAEDYGDPEGTTGYLWIGTGLRFASRRWVLFGEFSGFFGGDENKGIGNDWFFPLDPALAGGVQFRF